MENGKPALYENADFSGLVVPLPQYRTGSIYASDEESFAGRAAAACVPAGFVATLYSERWQQGESLVLEGPTELVLGDVGWDRRVQSVKVERIPIEPEPLPGSEDISNSDDSEHEEPASAMGSIRLRGIRHMVVRETTEETPGLEKVVGVFAASLSDGSAAAVRLHCNQSGGFPVSYANMAFSGPALPIPDGMVAGVAGQRAHMLLARSQAICVPYGFDVKLYDRSGQTGTTLLVTGPVEFTLSEIGWDGRVRSSAVASVDH